MLSAKTLSLLSAVYVFSGHDMDVAVGFLALRARPQEFGRDALEASVRGAYAGAYMSHRRAHERHVFVNLEDASAVRCVPVYFALPFVHLAWCPELSSWSGSIPFANGEVCPDCFAK